MVHAEIATQPLARIDYVSLADAETLALEFTLMFDHRLSFGSYE